MNFKKIADTSFKLLAWPLLLTLQNDFQVGLDNLFRDASF